MMAVILAAGYGTRMYPLTEQTPKALLPVGPSSILGLLVRKLAAPAVEARRIVLVSNHRFVEPFQRWFSSARLPGPWAVLDDGSTSDADRLGSVGDLAFAIRQEKIDDDLLVLGSDNLFDGDLADFMAFARAKDAITLGAYELPDLALASRYGVLELDASGRITAFTEKPARPASRIVSTAIYFFPRTAGPRVLEYVSSQKTADTLGSFISWLIARETVFAYRFPGRWFDIGDIASYKHAQETFHP
ncbi:MAG: nucleotidyltransferase family protein [Candidatus Omnitrophica bacterium]|nr:nucleotidyltransferase family protein [Candidatus Omnitrophota bacterium]